MKSNIYNIISKEYNNRRIKLLCKNSKAESHFAELLNNANIFYTKEKCCFNKYGKWCYIDFYLPLYHIAIEIDGIEHCRNDRKAKDIAKTKFLESERNIRTIRYSNQECLKMKSISIIDIVKKAGKTTTCDSKYISFKKMERNNEIRNVKEHLDIDINKSYWLYDKSKDTIFYFKDIYIMKHSTGAEYKFLVNAINADYEKSNIYIINESKELLLEQIDKYYDFIWNKRI